MKMKGQTVYHKKKPKKRNLLQVQQTASRCLKWTKVRKQKTGTKNWNWSRSAATCWV